MAYFAIILARRETVKCGKSAREGVAAWRNVPVLRAPSMPPRHLGSWRILFCPSLDYLPFSALYFILASSNYSVLRTP